MLLMHLLPLLAASAAATAVQELASADFGTFIEKNELSLVACKVFVTFYPRKLLTYICIK